MDADRFETNIIGLASRGVTLSVANVARHLGLGLEETEKRLDQLASRGRLDLELNEDTGALFYVVRGLDVDCPTAALTPTPQVVAPAAPLPQKRSLWAVLWAIVLPGLGLGYAAPWTVALGAGVGLWVVVQGLAALPLVGGLLSSVALGLGTVASVVLSLRYTRRFNQVGRRAHLDGPPGAPWLELEVARR